ncbi:hypothetical protein GCM10010468_82060 [Actinocorallia longicatena]|uniref:Uncharacterized protein n=1 Tax=Actinocorallia longicatena TaxID=111803 RepID=A0ABP6QN41_9ACTN
MLIARSGSECRSSGPFRRNDQRNLRSLPDKDANQITAWSDATIELVSGKPTPPGRPATCCASFPAGTTEKTLSSDSIGLGARDVAWQGRAASDKPKAAGAGQGLANVEVRPSHRADRAAQGGSTTAPFWKTLTLLYYV